MSGKLLVTGGAGYIGSHTCVVMQAAGYELVVLDNLSNSQRARIDQIGHISGKPLSFVEGDIRDAALLKTLFREHEFSAVIHFAGLKAVGESVSQPLRYYDWNVAGTLTLLQAMADAGVKRLIFSSSATVYGEPATVPIHEGFPLGATNPYGRSKLMIEEILGDLMVSDPTWRIARLRYFNPVGAHESGTIGEAPNGVPNNLMPYVAQVAAGIRPHLNVFGNDYPTPDGTGVRDFIHVMDLADGHLAALKYMEAEPGMSTVNLGTGQGYSVLDMVAAFAKVSGQAVPYQFVPRRSGDTAAVWADPALAKSLYGWQARRGLDEMCRDTWRWQQYWVAKQGA